MYKIYSYKCYVKQLSLQADSGYVGVVTILKHMFPQILLGQLYKILDELLSITSQTWLYQRVSCVKSQTDMSQTQMYVKLLVIFGVNSKTKSSVKLVVMIGVTSQTKSSVKVVVNNIFSVPAHISERSMYILCATIMNTQVKMQTHTVQIFSYDT
jgi:hypothetical protein